MRVSIFKRGIATILDIYISSVLAHIPILLIYSIETGEVQMTKELSALSTLNGVLACILGILIALFYYVILPVYKFDGQTLMKKTLGFKVVKMDGNNVDLNTMFKRELLGSMILEGGFVIGGSYLRQLILIIIGSKSLYKGLLYVSFVTTILSIIIMIFSKSNRAIHDYIAGTKVLNLKD
ncbi:RDD family protein [Anaerosalibacter massiliensis]|uniref:RDD family protein n=1 Tax=Anaerosalibacter massiliensis TaxID=1347392 RepID=A0A9X2MKD7_9FIRM|nr:RDD family protein [Anaerosalibacter massiliensis]MCR2045128.1 RDD family protein [Anaerosalibacter massiliensis]